MAAPQVQDNDLLELRLVSYAGEQIAVNVLHFFADNKVGDLDLEEVATLYDDYISPEYKDCLCDDARWRGVGCRRLNPTPTIEWFSIVNDGAGQRTGGLLPKQTCGVITWRSTVPGRTGRGRIYVSFPSDDDNDGAGKPQAAYVANLGLLADGINQVTTLIGGAGQVDVAPVVKPKGAFAPLRFIEFAVPRTRWGTQRRRGDYGKTNVLPF